LVEFIPRGLGFCTVIGRVILPKFNFCSEYYNHSYLQKCGLAQTCLEVLSSLKRNYIETLKTKSSIFTESSYLSEEQILFNLKNNKLRKGDESLEYQISQ